MALREDGDLAALSLVLTREQAGRLRSLATARSSKHRKVSISDVAREVVEAGLELVFRAPNTGIDGTAEDAEKEAVAA